MRMRRKRREEGTERERKKQEEMTMVRGGTLMKTKIGKTRRPMQMNKTRRAERACGCMVVRSGMECTSRLFEKKYGFCPVNCRSSVEKLL